MHGLQWYPMYPGDYARKTSHLSMLEHGALNLLLNYQYSTGEPLPVSNAKAMLKQCLNNDEGTLLDHSRIYRIAKAILDEEKQAVDYLLADFFILTEDGYVNEKAIEVIEKQKESYRKRAEAGRKGGASNSSNSKQSLSNNKAKPKQCSSNAQAMLKQPEPEPDIKEKLYKKEKSNNDQVSLNELTVGHVKDWLDEKRKEGFYLDINEDHLLDRYRNWCQAKNVKYACYAAGFKAAFNWDNIQKDGGSDAKTLPGNRNVGKQQRAAEAIKRGLE